MNRFTSSLAATTVWLAMASVLLQPIVGLACDCDCHDSTTCCVDVAGQGDAHEGHRHSVGTQVDDAMDDSERCHRVQVHACDIESAHVPSPSRCPECHSAHDAPIAAPLADSIRVDRDESLNARVTAIDAGFCTLSLEFVSGHLTMDRCVFGVSAQASCAIFCRFVI